MIKEKYLQIQNWLKTSNKTIIDFIKKEKEYAYSYFSPDDNPDDRLIKTLNWYFKIKKQNDYIKKAIFGEVIFSIEDIKNHILSKLKSLNISDYKDDKDDEEYNGYYDYSGHYNRKGLEAVIDFFENLNHNKILSIVEGHVEDDYEIDISGGRSYLMINTNLNEMIFNYLKYNTKNSLEELEDNICNSSDLFYDIECYYQNINIYLPNDEELSSIYNFLLNKKYNKLIDNYNSFIDNIIRNFKNEPLLKEKVDIAYSMKIDMNYLIGKLRENKISEILV